MGWIFRKGLKLGPIRISISKTGVGLSAGIKGARVGIDARGRKYSNLSLPGTGLGHRQSHGKVPGYSFTWKSMFSSFGNGVASLRLVFRRPHAWFILALFSALLFLVALATD